MVNHQNVVHIFPEVEEKEDTLVDSVTLCGLKPYHFFPSGSLNFLTWLDGDDWCMGRKPTCEACVLLHFYDPSLTKHVRYNYSIKIGETIEIER